ncbi:MAG: nitrilase-related carbon-nitrogen hydrolase [Candidatus Gastranaerophilaceae bacterium]
MAGILNIQLKSLLGDKETNLKKVEHYIKFNKDKKLDLVVMPEFFSTSIDYANAPEDENGGDTIKTLQRLAKEYNTNIIAGSVVRKVEGKLYNSAFAIDRMGEIIAIYDKVHLFNYMGGTEGQRITAGNEIKIAHFDFAKVGLTICYDMRYPIFINQIMKKGVQMIVMPTAWLIPKAVYENENNLKYAQEMFISMCRTRAYDNALFMVVSNQTKEVSKDFYGIGNSAIISPTAQVIANAENKECAIYADIDINEAKYMKQLFPVDKID